MTAELSRRRQLGRKVAAALGLHSDISAVLVFGSVASGKVDTASDIDIFVVCNEVPPIQIRTALVGSLDLRLETTAHEGGLFGTVDELLHRDGLELTLHYQRRDWLETIITEVLAGAITTQKVPFRPYTLLGLLQRSWVLHDKHGIVAGWLRRVRVYPPRLRENLLEAFVPQLGEHAAELTGAAARGLGTRTFIFHLNWGVDALISILLAANEQYDPADKRFESSALPLLTRKPGDFGQRLRNIMVGPFDEEGMFERAKTFQALADEVLTIAAGVRSPWKG